MDLGSGFEFVGEDLDLGLLEKPYLNSLSNSSRSCGVISDAFYLKNGFLSAFFFFLGHLKQLLVFKTIEVTIDHRNGTHTYVEAAAASYNGRDVLRVSECLELVYDAAARYNDILSHCADCDFDGYLYRLTGVY